MVIFSSLQLSEASSLKVLQFRNVLEEIQWIWVGESASLRHLPASNHLFHGHLHLLSADGVLQRDEEKKWLSFKLELTFIVVTGSFDRFSGIWFDVHVSLTGMSLVSSIRAGTCRADRAFRMAPLIFPTNSGQKGLPDAIFKNKITRSSPSLLYWGTQRLSVTSSNASTAERRGKGRVEDEEKKMRDEERRGGKR